jgi:hypothetical protein
MLLAQQMTSLLIQLSLQIPFRGAMKVKKQGDHH